MVAGRSCAWEPTSRNRASIAQDTPWRFRVVYRYGIWVWSLASVTASAPVVVNDSIDKNQASQVRRRCQPRLMRPWWTAVPSAFVKIVIYCDRLLVCRAAASVAAASSGLTANSPPKTFKCHSQSLSHCEKQLLGNVPPPAWGRTLSPARAPAVSYAASVQQD